MENKMKILIFILALVAVVVVATAIIMYEEPNRCGFRVPNYSGGEAFDRLSDAQKVIFFEQNDVLIDIYEVNGVPITEKTFIDPEKVTVHLHDSDFIGYANVPEGVWKGEVNCYGSLSNVQPKMIKLEIPVSSDNL